MCRRSFASVVSHRTSYCWSPSSPPQQCLVLHSNVLLHCCNLHDHSDIPHGSSLLPLKPQLSLFVRSITTPAPRPSFPPCFLSDRNSRISTFLQRSSRQLPQPLEFIRPLALHWLLTSLRTTVIWTVESIAPPQPPRCQATWPVLNSHPTSIPGSNQSLSTCEMVPRSQRVWRMSTTFVFSAPDRLSTTELKLEHR